MVNQSDRVQQARGFREMVANSPHVRAAARSTSIARSGLSTGVQRQEKPSEQEPAQIQLQSVETMAHPTGLPDDLKRGIENLSGYSMDDIKVHYNSTRPAQLQALAYTRGTDIYLRPGREKHLPHEAWHAVQQKQNRVKPTFRAGGMAASDDTVLEQEADVMGARAQNFAAQNSRPIQTSGQDIVQRKIGAEIEVVGAVLEYPDGTPVTQGEKVGAIVPGIETEIHLEGPEREYATFEFATGLHGQYPPDNPLSLAFQVGYLATWVETGKRKGTQLLKDRALVALESKWAKINHNNGPALHVDRDAQGAFQINVSPSKESAGNFQNLFNDIHTFAYSNGVLTAQARAVNNCLRDAKTFAFELYDNIVARIEQVLDKEELPSLLKSTLKALTNVPRVSYFKYLRSLEGFTSAAHGIIDKNILEVLPRANIQELWAKTIADPAVTELGANWAVLLPEVLDHALGQTAFPTLRQVEAINPDLDQNEQLEIARLMQQGDDLLQRYRSAPTDELEEQLQQHNLEIRMKRLLGDVVESDSAEDAVSLRKTALTDMLDVVAGGKILVKDRAKKRLAQPMPILTDTDSSLLPVNREQGEAGVFEIRNPFSQKVPTEDWAGAVAAYEDMLYQKGVRY
ncbi:MAG: DUF4157 domain-containing protein [Proteobacteria bacterium]|nr:DUF4157 domain-containing protein [Pseudomonadota bacterium]